MSRHLIGLNPVPADQWQHLGVPGLLAVWRGAGFEVLHFRAPAPCVARLAVRRLDAPSRYDHRAPEPYIPWDMVQGIKGLCGFPRHEGVEIFPPDDHIVRTANARHLWILAERLPFSWRTSGPDAAPHYWGAE